jgi:hypothetical protein
MLETKELPRPIHPCLRCKSDNWYQTKWGDWQCGTCHPNPNAENRLTPNK